MRKLLPLVYAAMVLCICLSFSWLDVLAQGSWATDSSTGFSPRMNHTATVVDGKIYVIGGRYMKALNTLEVFDPQTHSWNTPATTGLFIARHNHIANAVKGKIYVMGGDSGAWSSPTGILAGISVFDPSTNTWSSLLANGTVKPRNRCKLVRV